jgi:ComF family protein
MRAAIHALKYKGIHPAADGLGRMLAQAIGQLATEAPAQMLVVPIPLHRSKQSQRGFNQARSLAVSALRCLRKTHPEWKLTLAPSTLIRHHATASQAGLTPRQRRLNVRRAFSVSDPAAIEGKHILLIDDILTTGATARAAALAVTQAGATSVWVATLSRARLLSPFSRESWQEPEHDMDLTGDLPAIPMQPESIYSSQDQPSF